MKTINEIDDKEMIINHWNDEVVTAGELKKKWNGFDEKHRWNCRIATEITARADADYVLDDIFDEMEQRGYLNMSRALREDVTDEFKERLQTVLDEISKFPSASFYDDVEHIDTNVEWMG